jgi:hypothetical protein
MDKKTKKQNKKKDKKDKYLDKDKIKNRDERFKEVMIIRDKLTNLGLSSEIEGIKDFYEKCREYVNSGYSWSGKIKLLGTKRILQGNLTLRKNIECSINLKYDESV